MWKAEKAIERIDRASIAGTGLHLSEFVILEVLLHKGPLPINAISEKVRLTSGSMTAAVNRLTEKGLVERIRHPSDGRCFQVHLTSGGRTLIEQAFRKHADELETVADVLTPSERGELVRLLKKIGLHAGRLIT